MAAELFINNKAVVLIVAECNVNISPYSDYFVIFPVLIVAECNVNTSLSNNIIFSSFVLIVAECNVNA